MENLLAGTSKSSQNATLCRPQAVGIDTETVGARPRKKVHEVHKRCLDTLLKDSMRRNFAIMARSVQ